MAIKNSIFLLFFVFCENLFSQKANFIVTPHIHGEFGKNSYDILTDETVSGLELLPLTRVGNIAFGTINFGLDIGLKREQDHFGIYARTSSALNGYKLFFDRPQFLPTARFTTSVTTNSIRHEFGFVYTRENLLPWEFRNNIQFRLGFSFNKTTFLELITNNLAQNMYIAERSNQEVFSRVGVHTSITYLIPLYTKNKRNLFDLGFTYSQGLVVIDETNVSIVSNQTPVFEVRTFSRGSFFSFSLSRTIHFKKQKHEIK